jgi:Ca2+-binding EF-hand superfamily protein
VSALSTVALLSALLVLQQQEQNDRVGPVNGGSTAVAPLMRDGLGSVFALSSLTGGVGQGAIMGGATGGGLDLYGAGTAGAMSGYGGMVGGAGPYGLAEMGGGSLSMPSAMGHGMNAMGGRGGVAGFHSPSRRGLAPKGLAAHGKATPAGKYSLLSAQAPTAALDPLLKGLITSGPLSHDEANLIVHAMVASESSAAKDPLAKASLRDASRKFAAPKANADANALQAKMDTLVPGASDAASRPIDGDTLRAWFGALDVSNDGAISFLEWRDRTGLGIDSFRAFDTSGEGLIQFEELERALVQNAVSEGRAVDPALVDALHPEAAAEKTGDAAAAKAAKAEPAPKLPLEELLKQVRTLLAKAAAQQSALASTTGTATATDAKGKAGAPGAKGKQAPSPFDLLGTAPTKSAPKKPAPKKPASAPYAPSSGNY